MQNIYKAKLLSNKYEVYYLLLYKRAQSIEQNIYSFRSTKLCQHFLLEKSKLILRIFWKKIIHIYFIRIFKINIKQQNNTTVGEKNCNTDCKLKYL